MAITGTGTQADPWIVHNYDEIKDVLVNKISNNTYAKLANDIDCNEYGDTWEWETITLGANWVFEFDLGGHTIKNIMIKSGNSLFYGKSTVNVIRNGKILNVFNNDGESVIAGNGLTLKDISMSINGTGLTSYAFNFTKFQDCAIYFKSNKLLDHFYNHNTGTSEMVKNSDFYFEIGDMNYKNLFHNITSVGLIDSCRFRGKIGGNKDYGWLHYYAVNNSVIEIDTTESTGYNSATMNISQGTIINTDICSETQTATQLIKCTTAQRRDADYLNSIGFTVVKVGE